MIFLLFSFSRLSLVLFIVAVVVCYSDSINQHEKFICSLPPIRSMSVLQPNKRTNERTNRQQTLIR